MALFPVYTSSDITSIAANNAVVDEVYPCEGIQSFRFENLLPCPIYVYDDLLRLVSVLPASTADERNMPKNYHTTTLRFRFDNTKSGQGGAFTTNNASQLYFEFFTWRVGRTGEASGLT